MITGAGTNRANTKIVLSVIALSSQPGAPPFSSVEAMNNRLVWIDCEMTGLDLARDALIEVAVLVTDSELEILDEGLDIVINAPDELLDDMKDVVADMHASSGLTEAVRASTVTLAEAEQQVLDYVKRFVPEPRTTPLAGNSIATDRGFLARDMPALDDHLHYRMVDVSSIKELTRRWYPRVYYAQPDKGMQHRALADIEESIQELRYYRRAVFVPHPGPNTDEARAIASEISGKPADHEAGSPDPL
jgi:oligoribonuclease